MVQYRCRTAGIVRCHDRRDHADRLRDRTCGLHHPRLWSVPRIQGKWGHDPNVVVVDEAMGMCITFMFPAASMGWVMWACSVFLFRLFDVMKPWPISVINDRTEAWAVLGDDVLAGLFAGFSTQLIATALMALGIVDTRLFLGQWALQLL